MLCFNLPQMWHEPYLICSISTATTITYCTSTFTFNEILTDISQWTDYRFHVLYSYNAWYSPDPLSLQSKAGRSIPLCTPLCNYMNHPQESKCHSYSDTLLHRNFHNFQKDTYLHIWKEKNNLNLKNSKL